MKSTYSSNTKGVDKVYTIKGSKCIDSHNSDVLLAYRSGDTEYTYSTTNSVLLAYMKSTTGNTILSRSARK